MVHRDNDRRLYLCDARLQTESCLDVHGMFVAGNMAVFFSDCHNPFRIILTNQQREIL